MSESSQFFLYTAPDGAVKVDVFFRGETVWLTQKALAELFGVKVPAINKHLKNIYESGELSRVATVSKMEMVRVEGEREVMREVEFYNLDTIIAVGHGQGRNIEHRTPNIELRSEEKTSFAEAVRRLNAIVPKEARATVRRNRNVLIERRMNP